MDPREFRKRRKERPEVSSIERARAESAPERAAWKHGLYSRTLEAMPCDEKCRFAAVCPRIGEERECVLEREWMEQRRPLLARAVQENGGDQTTVLPLKQGLLLPGNWPHAFDFCHNLNGGGAMYMPWWGKCRAGGAALSVVDTPADASVAISHPAGGPTRVGVQWDGSLGRFAYPRLMKLMFLPRGDFVALAKAYRRHVQAQGRFVGLREKIARRARQRGLDQQPSAGAVALAQAIEQLPEHKRQQIAEWLFGGDGEE